MKWVIIVDSERCTGCRACELACSFHHTRTFTRKQSSVEVHRDEGKGRMLVTIHEQRRGRREPCDNCFGEREPLCTRFCTVDALKAMKPS